MSTERRDGRREPEIECMIYPDTIRTTVMSAVNEQIQINNTLTLTILVKERRRRDYIVTFPWGDKPQYLAPPDGAQGITCSPLTGAWTASRESESEIGDYWRISGGSGEDRMIQVQWNGITAVREGITCIRVKPVEEGEDLSQASFYQIPLFKIRPLLRIERFCPDRGTVAKGCGVTLSWKVQGAQSCILDPGNIPVKAEGSRMFFLQREEEFTLRAFYGEKAVSETRRVYVSDKE